MMTSPNEALEKLAKLSKREREVLWLRCDGVDYKTIGERLAISVPTVKADMGRIYVKLELDHLPQAQRTQQLFQVFCPVLKNSQLPPEPPESAPAEPVPPEVEQMVEDDEKPLVLRGTSGPPAPRPSPPVIIPPYPERPGRSPARVIAGIVVGLLAIVGLVSIMSWLTGDGETPLSASETPEVLITQVTVVVTAPSEPTVAIATPTQEQVVATKEIVVTREVVIVVTATPQPLQNPSATPVPGITLPFQDNFDQGMRPEWQVISGEPVLVDGRLQTVHLGDLMLQLGTPPTDSYTIGFDRFCEDANSSVQVSLAQEVQFYLNNRWQWKASQGGEWVLLDDGYISNCSHYFQIRVAGNSYALIADNATVFEGIYGTAVRGPIVITIEESAIDNFSLISP
jgi:DNA-binding CsgD family transcriptional regulator